MENDEQLPRRPEAIMNLSPKQRSNILRRFWKIAGMIVLKLLPLPTLLIVGLSVGPLPAIAVYTVLLTVTSALLWRMEKDRRSPWAQPAVYLAVPLGIAALFTGNPFWFQIELSAFGVLILLAAATKWMFREPGLPDMGFEALLDASSSLRLKRAFFAGILAIAAVNAWLVKVLSFETWLWFRCFAVFGLLAVFMISTVTKISHADRSA